VDSPGSSLEALVVKPATLHPAIRPTCLPALGNPASCPHLPQPATTSMNTFTGGSCSRHPATE
jgi:hypothetical protein